MKILKNILFTVIGIVVVLVLISFFLPSSYRVERALTMNAKPEAIFPYLNTLKTWPEWTAWTVQKYPDMKTTFSGPESGVGATYQWDGKTSGQGMLKLTSSDPAKGIGYDLDFQAGTYVSKGTITMQATGDTTRVTWANFGDIANNPIHRYFGLFLDRMMGPDFEEGLNKLKQKVETK